MESSSLSRSKYEPMEKVSALRRKVGDVFCLERIVYQYSLGGWSIHELLMYSFGLRLRLSIMIS